MIVGDSELGIVTSYYHDEAFSDRSKFPEIFYVFVAPIDEDSHVKKRPFKGVNISRCFGYDVMMYKHTRDTLIELGWEEVGPGQTDYLFWYL